MPKVERITVLLSEPEAAEIQAAAEAGEYGSANEVLSEAVRLWSDGRQARADTVERLRRAWDAGAASPTHGPLSFEVLRHEARARLAAARDARPPQDRADPMHAG